MPQTTREHRLRCRRCSENGLLSITSDKAGWSFATVGFIGLAVSRTNPSSSILRCNTCRSMDVDVEPPGPATV